MTATPLSSAPCVSIHRAGHVPAAASAVLVTGASAGIGAAFARELARRGHPLVLVARTESALDELAATLPVPVSVVVADLTTTEGLARTEEALVTASPAIRLVINNAGSATYGDLSSRSATSLEQSVLLNVLAPTQLTAAALRVLPRGGGIINVSSTAAGRDDPETSVYAAGKAYLESLSRAARREGEDRRISVTVVRPGRTRTDFHDRSGEESDHLPADRWQSPEDVVRAALAAYERGEPEVTVAPWSHAV